MTPLRRFSRCHGKALLLALALVLLPGVAAQGQRLLTLVPGASAASTADGTAGDLGPSVGPSLGPSLGPMTTAVQVDLELLRTAPARLEAPTPDGFVLTAERSVFEDRGGGDLMWSGRTPGAGYDTVVLTVEGGRLVGRFGSAGGGLYEIHSEWDGRGGMAPVVGSTLENWCGAGGEADQHLEQELAAASQATRHGAGHLHRPLAEGPAGTMGFDLPPGLSWSQSQAQEQTEPKSDGRLDILVFYTALAAKNWAHRGGAEAAIRHAGDYLKMVFRNNGIDEVEPHIVHMAQASDTLDRVGRDIGLHQWQGWSQGNLLSALMRRDYALTRLPIEHEADRVLLFTGEPHHMHGDFCGKFSQLKKLDIIHDWANVDQGWVSNAGAPCPDYVVAFVHEIGHGLGAGHDPAYLLGFLDSRDPADVLAERVRPYGLGHVNHDVMPSLGTAMSYQGQIEPFFSSSRLRPWGGVSVGVAGEQDNERLLRETVHFVASTRQRHAARWWRRSLAQPSRLRAWFEGSSVHLSWQNNAPEADRYSVSHGYHRAGEFVSYKGYWAEGLTGTIIPLEATARVGRHEFWVWARKGHNDLVSEPTKVVVFYPGAPVEPPSNVSVTIYPSLGGVDVRWDDNSEDETGFDLQLLRDGEVIYRRRLSADSTSSLVRADSVDAFHVGAGVRRRVIERGAEYGARVFAFSEPNHSQAASETVTFRWDHPEAPGSVTDLVATAIGPTTVRLSWTDDLATTRYHVRAYLPGWQEWREWSPNTIGSRRDGDTLWRDFEGLARGGRYRFTVGGSLAFDAEAHLVLGERGAGPTAPSDLRATREGGRWVLHWKDNSDDELGFVTQGGYVRPGGGGFGQIQDWYTGAVSPGGVVTPPNVSSAPYRGGGNSFRVFAYNDRGFSPSSPVFVMDQFVGLTATPGDGSVQLRWDGLRSYAGVTGIQLRWKATDAWKTTDALPLDDAMDDWTDLPVSATSYLVAGLENGTRYTFALRRLRDEGASWPVTLEATPFGVCRGDAETLCLADSRFRVGVDWWDAAGNSGAGRVVEAPGDDSGLFQFFGPRNWEVLIKVLDGCATNGRTWVLGASTTDLGYRITVTDMITGESRSYENEPGQPAPAIVDTEAFSGACAGAGS